MFTIAASGSCEVIYMLAKLELLSRTDIFSLVFCKVTGAFTDIICYEVPLLNIEKKELIWAIIPKILIKKARAYEDLAKLREFPCGSSQYLLLCKSEKVFSIIYTKEIQNSLDSCGDSLKMLYVSSDISVVLNSNLLVRVTFQHNQRFTNFQVKFMQKVVDSVIEQISKYEFL